MERFHVAELGVRVDRRRRCTRNPEPSSVRRASLFDGRQFGRRRAPRRDRRVAARVMRDRRHLAGDRVERRRRRLGRDRRRTARRRPRRPRLRHRHRARARSSRAPALAGRTARVGRSCVFGQKRLDLGDRPQRERQQLFAERRRRRPAASAGGSWYGRWSCAASSHVRAPVVLPSLVPSAAFSSGHENACTCTCRLRRMRSTPDDDVAPLIGPADLDQATEVVVEPEVVVRLEQHVAELGERDAVLALEPDLHALAGQHLVDRHVLADVAQELEQRDRLGPVVGCRPAPHVHGSTSRRCGRVVP